MFKPKKEDPATKNKTVMPVESGMPKSAVIRKQLDEAMSRRGMIVEQAWTTSKPNQKFVLMCQFDKSADTPVWTLYEENAQESKMHFSQPFEPNDFAMMYDVICMSAPDGGSAGIPDALKPHDTRKSDPAPYPASSSSYGSPAPAPSTPPSPSPYGGGSPYPAAPSATPYPAYPQPQSPYAAPPAAPYPNYPPPQPQYNAPPPQPPYNAPPPPQPPYNAPPPQYNAPPPQPPYNNPMNAPSPWQQGYAQPPAPAPVSPPANPYSAAPQLSPGTSSADKSGLQPVDYTFMQKKSHILLGTLLFESGLLSEPTLQAALKIQEFVNEERMSPAQASEVLKRHHNMGNSIDQYLNPSDFDGKAPAPKAQAPSQPARPGALPPEKLKLQQAAIDLLQKSGILKEDDLKIAHAVRSKHGGDMVAILQAAGKLEAVVYKAAETCVPLIKDGLMKFEQCIIALNYCSRSRVDFDTALDELGWENPRKAPK